MNKAAQINDLLNERFDKSPRVVWVGTVQAVDGLTCTVALANTDLVVEGVQLRADLDATDGVLLTPRVGSLVYVATVENALDNLFIVQGSELDRVDVVYGTVSVTLSKDGVVLTDDQCRITVSNDAVRLKQEQTELTLSGGKVTMKNAGVNLKDVLSGVLTLLNTFQVICAAPGAPSAPSPTTAPQVAQLQTQLNQLLT